MSIVYPLNGTSPQIDVPIGDTIAIFTQGIATIESAELYSNIPSIFSVYSAKPQINNEEVILGPFSTVKSFMITAESLPVYYEVGAENETKITIKSTINYGIPAYLQPNVTAKTTSTTLTASELLSLYITVNQGAGGPSALQLPLATSMDTALPLFTANVAFDFTLDNISTVGAEDATITTNTGWTLVGSMAVQSNDAVTSKSTGVFQAKKTGDGTWTLSRK